jgi:hypothetical protein
MLNYIGHPALLDLLTDATVGINKVSIISNLAETAKQTITWDSAVGTEGATVPDDTGTVSMTVTPLVFDITAGETVSSVGLYHDTILWGYILFSSTYYFANAGEFRLTDITISIGNA